MQVPQVVDVDVVLDEELPVALGVVVDARHLHERSRAERLESLGEPAHRLGEARRVRGRVDEDHAVPLRGGGGHEGPTGLVDPVELLLLLRYAHQRAVKGEAPLVVRAGEVAPEAAGALHQRQAAVTAQVVEGMERSVGAADDEHRDAGDRRRHVVAGTAELVGGGDERPRAGEEQASFGVEHGLGAVEVAKPAGAQGVELARRPAEEVGGSEHPHHRFLGRWPSFTSVASTSQTTRTPSRAVISAES